MQSCELVATITALACAIANNCSVDEITVMAAAFNQLGDTLTTILAQEASINPPVNLGLNDQNSDTDHNTNTKNTNID